MRASVVCVFLLAAAALLAVPIAAQQGVDDLTAALASEPVASGELFEVVASAVAPPPKAAARPPPPKAAARPPPPKAAARPPPPKAAARPPPPKAAARPPPPKAAPAPPVILEKPVRQTFIWKLTDGANVTAAIATRIAIYNRWNLQYTAVPSYRITNYWIAAQNDSLIGAPKDPSWYDLTGFTDWSGYTVYDAFKTWERGQPDYRAIPVANRTRVVAYIS